MGGVAIFSRSQKENSTAPQSKEIVRPVNKKRKTVERKVGDEGVGRVLKRRAIYA